MPSSTFKREFYFSDPRLRMTALGREAVRTAGWLSYALLGTATFTFLVSDLAWLNWLGALLALFILDRVIHLREGDRPIPEMPVAGRINLAFYMNPQAFRAVERAYGRSSFAKENFYLELARELAERKDVKDALRRVDVAPAEFEQKIDEFLAVSREAARKQAADDRRIQAEIAVLMGGDFALREKQRFIEPEDLFAGLPNVQDEMINRLFKVFSIEPRDVEKAVVFQAARHHLGWRTPAGLGAIIPGVERGMRHRIMNRAWTSRPTPMLDQCSIDLTDLARQNSVGFLVGHEAEYGRLIEGLSRPINPNMLLVGEAGIGKETIVNHFAFDLVKDRVPKALFDKRLVELRLSSLVAGLAPEELQDRIKMIVEEIMLAGNIILYIPEIHNLLQTSGQAYLSAADALMPVIMNNSFPIVGATYPREYKQMIEPRSDFAGAFEAIRVVEITAAEAEKILTYESILLERQTGVFVTFGAIKTAVGLAKKYVRTKFLPASAEELLKTAITAAESKRTRFVGPEEVIQVVEERVNVPLRSASEAEAKDLLNLEAKIGARLVGQEEAIKAVANSLRQYRSGLARRGGPIASFLFVGPTGVGKTELAKILAEIQFGSTNAMFRFDMSEFQDKTAISRFLGSPDGAVRGALTEAVLEKPYGLILLDEFEKASPDILNLFLQVLDDGHLTDGLGRLVDFQNTIVIATSNAHSEIITDALSKGETVANIGEYVKRRLTEVFRPELLNRFSRVIVFRDLSPKEMQTIAALNLEDLARVAGSQGIDISFDPTAVALIAKLGYEPAFGARPLRRAIDEHLREALAEKILEGKAGRGGGIRVAAEGDRFTFITTLSYAEDIAPPLGGK